MGYNPWACTVPPVGRRLQGAFSAIYAPYLVAHGSDVPSRVLGLIAAGVGSLIAFQTLVNVAVATGMMCNTGIPLPFVSAGSVRKGPGRTV